MLRHDIEEMVGRNISLTILTDSESFFKVIIKATITTEKRLMVYVRDAREAYQRSGISDVGWVRPPQNISDGLNNISRCNALELFIDDGIIYT